MELPDEELTSFLKGLDGVDDSEAFTPEKPALQLNGQGFACMHLC